MHSHLTFTTIQRRRDSSLCRWNQVPERLSNFQVTLLASGRDEVQTQFHQMHQTAFLSIWTSKVLCGDHYSNFPLSESHLLLLLQNVRAVWDLSSLGTWEGEVACPRKSVKPWGVAMFAIFLRFCVWISLDLDRLRPTAFQSPSCILGELKLAC